MVDSTGGMQWLYLRDVPAGTPTLSGSNGYQHVAVAVKGGGAEYNVDETTVECDDPSVQTAIETWVDIMNADPSQCFFVSTEMEFGLAVPDGCTECLNGSLYGIFELKNAKGSCVNYPSGMDESNERVLCLCVDLNDPLVFKNIQTISNMQSLFKTVASSSSMKMKSGEGPQTQLFVGATGTTSKNEQIQAALDQFRDSTGSGIRDGDVLILAMTIDKSLNVSSRPTRSVASLTSSSSSTARRRRHCAPSTTSTTATADHRAKLKANLFHAYATQDHDAYERALSAAKPHIDAARSLPDSLHEAGVVIPEVLAS